MKIKIIIASLIILIGIVFGAVSFMESSVEYTGFSAAKSTHRKVHVKGEWVREKGGEFDATKSQFVFYMRDDDDEEMKVVLEGAKPNNFEVATSIVVKGSYQNGYFHASELLTKCPSKYEGDAESVKKML